MQSSKLRTICQKPWGTNIISPSSTIASNGLDFGSKFFFASKWADQNDNNHSPVDSGTVKKLFRMYVKMFVITSVNIFLNKWVNTCPNTYTKLCVNTHTRKCNLMNISSINYTLFLCNNEIITIYIIWRNDRKVKYDLIIK